MQHLNLHLRPGLGHLRLVDLEALHAAMRQIGRPIEGRPSPMLGRLLEARSDTAAARRPLSDATIGRVHANVTSARSTAVKRRTIPVNPGSTSSCRPAAPTGHWCGPNTGCRSGAAPANARPRRW
jgi:hypothetical protein